MSYYIEIVRYEDDGVEKRIGPYSSMRLADKADSGVNHNLDHGRFFTVVMLEGESYEDQEA